MEETRLHTVYLALGTNLGDRVGNIRRATERIGELIGRVVRRSALYESEPFGFLSDHWFVNAALCCTTTLTPRQLLVATQQIEREMGRTVKSVNGVYHDRTIDIDILLYDDISINEPDLQIPHPRMRERSFVMRPLADVMPQPLDAQLPTDQKTHPISGKHQ